MLAFPSGTIAEKFIWGRGGGRGDSLQMYSLTLHVPIVQARVNHLSWLYGKLQSFQINLSSNPEKSQS